jgi:PIN domain nuclease of toxin-antitoxin system
MSLLLDTHIFLWYISGDPRLSASVRGAIDDPNIRVFLSVGSFWEIVIKYDLGKLPPPQRPETYIPSQRKLHRIDSLPFEESDVQILAGLPAHHRDPFDRMIVCQAIANGLTIVTVDPMVKKYAVPIL